MLITRITGDQIRAARSLAGLSQEALAARTGLCRQTIRAYELSSGAVPAATVNALDRVLSALESEGVCFVEGGVSLHRPAQRPAAPAQSGIDSMRSILTAPVGA